jgi:hypothetical protein
MLPIPYSMRRYNPAISTCYQYEYLPSYSVPGGADTHLQIASHHNIALISGTNAKYFSIFVE